MNLPPHAYFEVTRQCNQQCPFCSCTWLEKNAEIRPEMSLDEWKAAAEEMIANGVRYIGVTGGEPTLKDGVKELIRFLSARLDFHYPDDHVLALFTNGKSITPDWFELLKECGAELYTSLPGLQTFGSQTGEAPNGYRKVLPFIYTASERGIRVSVGITITKNNLSELYEICSYAALSGARSVILNLFKPSGRGKYHPELCLTREDILFAAKTAEEVASQCGNGIDFGGEFPEWIRQDDYPHLKIENRCAAVRGTFTIAPDGWIHLCEHDAEGLCSWRDWKSLETSEKWDFFLSTNPQVCPLF